MAFVRNLAEPMIEGHTLENGMDSKNSAGSSKVQGTFLAQMMKIMFRAVASFLAYGNGAVALSALAYTAMLSAYFGRVSPPYLAFVLFGTFAAYAYMHLMSAAQHPDDVVHPVRKYTRGHRVPIAVAGCLSGLVAVFLWTRHFSVFGVPLIPVAVVVALYPGLGRHFRGLRARNGLKLPLIVGVWFSLVALLPLGLSAEGPPLPESVWVLSAVGAWILGTALFFDLRDFDIDPQGFTLPQKWGQTRSLRIVQGLYAGSALLFLFYGGLHSDWRIESWGAVGCLVAAVGLTQRWSRSGDPMVVSLWIEILPVFWLLFGVLDHLLGPHLIFSR